MFIFCDAHLRVCQRNNLVSIGMYLYTDIYTGHRLAHCDLYLTSDSKMYIGTFIQ